MNIVKYSVWLLLFCVSACSAGNNPKNWQGSYSYYESGGQTAGGSQIMMDINLKIDFNDPKSRCILKMEGYQKNEVIYCDFNENDSLLDITFKSYDDGSTKNKYGIERYKVGSILFSIKPKGNAKDGNKYQPIWKAYSPFGDRSINSNEYFEKSSGTK